MYSRMTTNSKAATPPAAAVVMYIVRSVVLPLADEGLIGKCVVRIVTVLIELCALLNTESAVVGCIVVDATIVAVM